MPPYNLESKVEQLASELLNEAEISSDQHGRILEQARADLKFAESFLAAARSARFVRASRIETLVGPPRQPLDRSSEVDTAAHPPSAPPVLLTTAPSLEDHRVIETIDIITAECVFGMNIFRDLFSGLTDVFGGRSRSSQKVLRDARRACLAELREEAHSVGANAVIAVNLDYSEFSGGGKSMLFLVASGTAVRAESLAITATKVDQSTAASQNQTHDGS